MQTLESIQIRASRIALSQKRCEMPHHERCDVLKWDTLEKRREYLSLIECYKTVFGLNGITFSDVLEYRHSRSTRSNHNYTIYTKLPKTNCYKYSYFVRIISSWNSLSGRVVEVTTLNEFKSQLKRYMNLL